MSIAFFLSDQGDLIHVPDSHIAVVIRDPQRFGLTKAEIEAAYLRHGERIGIEGEARKELLLKVVSQGWLRIRRYRNHWSVTAQALNPATQELLRCWARKMLVGVNGGFKEWDRYISVKVTTAERETICAIGDLAEGCYPHCGRQQMNEYGGLV